MKNYIIDRCRSDIIEFPCFCDVLHKNFQACCSHEWIHMEVGFHFNCEKILGLYRISAPALAQFQFQPKCGQISVFGQICKVAHKTTAMFWISTIFENWCYIANPLVPNLVWKMLLSWVVDRGHIDYAFFCMWLSISWTNHKSSLGQMLWPDLTTQIQPNRFQLDFEMSNLVQP
jgi:hypothetical protein